MRRAAVRMRHMLLMLVNALATALTLLTGLRENALVALATGRFDHMRARLREARVSYALAVRSLKHVAARTLPDLTLVADAYKFHRAPTRSPANLGEDRSTCLRVNAMNASVLHVHFDDAFGRGPRREQVVVWSISAPHCDVLNLQPHRLAHTRATQFHDNATACDAFVLTHFEQLQHDRAVQVGVPVDFGAVGVPYLKCKGRPAATTPTHFQYLTDLLVFQSFWVSAYQVEFQTSRCGAVAAAFDEEQDEGLFRVEAADQEATVTVAVPSTHWLISLVSSMYSVVYLAFLERGVLATIATGQQYVTYDPASTKRAAFGGLADWVPSATIVSWFVPMNDQTKVCRFHASSIVAANMWLNQWVYITLSIADACVNFRSVYMMLTMRTWMLTKRVTFENFLFMCTPS